MATRPSHRATLTCCSTRSLWGWSPPPLPADTHLKRFVDRVLPRTGLAAVLYFAAIWGLLNLATALPVRWSLTMDGLAALAAGGWCSLNFWLCRHAHCLVTGVGWLALGVFAVAEAGIGRSLIGGHEEHLLLGVLVAGLLFEGMWCRVRGTNAVTSIPSGRPPAVA